MNTITINSFIILRELGTGGFGTVKLAKFDKVKVKKTRCDYELCCKYKNIIALDKDTMVPYKICSFDIEASSSHGDFPEAIKDYKKVAYDIVYRLEKASKDDYGMLLKEFLLNVFNLRTIIIWTIKRNFCNFINK